MSKGSDLCPYTNATHVESKTKALYVINHATERILFQTESFRENEKQVPQAGIEPSSTWARPVTGALIFDGVLSTGAFCQPGQITTRHGTCQGSATVDLVMTRLQFLAAFTKFGTD